jgi:hypothetical protein
MSKFFLDQAAKLKSSSRARAQRIGNTIEAVTGMPGALRSTMDAMVAAPDWQFLNGDGTKDRRAKTFRSVFQNLNRAKATVRELRGEMVKGGKPTLPTPDKNDLFAEMQRAELRSIFRSLPDDKRTLRGQSPAMIQAVLQADPIASGISPAEHAMARDEMTREMFPEQVAALGDDVEALQLLEESIRIAEAEMVKTSGVDRQFLKEIAA